MYISIYGGVCERAIGKDEERVYAALLRGETLHEEPQSTLIHVKRKRKRNKKRKSSTITPTARPHPLSPVVTGRLVADYSDTDEEQLEIPQAIQGN